MTADPADMQRDRMVERDPEAYEDVMEEPEPEREIPPPPPPQLFNVDHDPYEHDDLADAHPDRVARMLAELEAWFAAVEEDRSRINDRDSGTGYRYRVK